MIFSLEVMFMVYFHTLKARSSTGEGEIDRYIFNVHGRLIAFYELGHTMVRMKRGFSQFYDFNAIV